MKEKIISVFVLMLFTLSLFWSSPAPVHAITWWNTDWSYKMKITINATKIDADLTDFPVMVYLNSSRIDWTHVRDDINDLVFVDSTGTVILMRDIENYTINNEAWIWVKIPSISSTVDTDFYLYYGNSEAFGYGGSEDVWDSSAVMVQHMYDIYNTTYILDSTYYDNDGVKKAINEPIEVDGKIGNALSFDGDDIVQIPSSASLNPASAITLVGSVQLHAPFSSGYPSFVFQPNANDPSLGTAYGIGVGYSIPVLRFWLSTTSVYGQLCYSGVTLSYDIWYHIVATYDGSYMRIYINGVLVGTPQALTGSIAYKANQPVKIGKHIDSYWIGLIDEVRIYNRALSAAEIKADYNSGNDSLLLYGAESLVPLALTVRYNIGINKLYINNTQITNNTTVYIAKNSNVNVTAVSQSNYIFYRHMLGLSGVSLIPMYLFNMTQPFTLWSYATPNFYIYEEPSTFTFSQWMMLLFITLGIALLAAIKFHAIAVASFILTLYMIINVAEFESMILLAIIVWLLTIMFSIIAFMEL